MKHLRHFCIATILTITLAFSAFAGDIHCGVVSGQSSQQSITTGETTTGETASGETSDAETAYVDPVTGLALDLLQSLLSLF